MFWFLPDTVINERTFQMVKVGCKYLESVEKLEKLLNHNLNITDEIVKDRVDSTINKQLKEKSINNIKLDTNKVHWENIISSSLKRIPPFEDNKSEKGFRDALILEAFNQLVENSHKTPSVCKIAFVSDDSLLMEAVKDRTKENANVRYFNDIPELQSFINILVSEMEESMINDISKDASILFFDSENSNGLYFRENIRDKINNKYSEELSKQPNQLAQKVDQGTWYISNVNFVKKQRQRFWWSSTIRVELTAYKFATPISRRLATPLESDIYDPAEYQRILARMQLLREAVQKPDTNRLSVSKLPSSNYEEYMKGATKFDVVWSVTLSVHNKLINPKIEEIKLIETKWENG